MMRTVQFAVTCVLALIATAGQVQAGGIIYSDRAAFEAALGNPISIETFNDAILNSGLSFTSTTGAVNISSERFNDRLLTSTHTTFHFEPQIYGFGANFDLSPGGIGLGIKVSTITPGGDIEPISQEILGNYTGQFWGFISENAIASVRLAGGTGSGVAETYFLDNLTYGGSAQVAAVPEPTSLAVFGVGACIAGVGVARRRRRDQQQVATA